jgi:hypothetical protein
MTRKRTRKEVVEVSDNKKTQLLDRESLLKREELKIVKVEFDDGGFVYVRQMYGRERDRFEKSILVQQADGKGGTKYETDLEDFRAKLAVQTVCDAKGNNLLRPEDAAELSKNMSAYKLEKIVEVAQSLNKISEEDRDEMLKNLGPTPQDDSTSG